MAQPFSIVIYFIFYYYRTTDRSIDVGDNILVPAGKSNRKELVEVTRKEKFYEDELPTPLEEVKSVIGKVILTQDQNSESFISEEAQKLNAFKANRGTHEVDLRPQTESNLRWMQSERRSLQAM